jgi:hypothetical protein
MTVRPLDTSGWTRKLGADKQTYYNSAVSDSLSTATKTTDERSFDLTKLQYCPVLAMVNFSQ